MEKEPNTNIKMVNTDFSDDNQSDFDNILDIIEFKSLDNSLIDENNEIFSKDYLNCINFQESNFKKLAIDNSDYKTGDTEFCSKYKTIDSNLNKNSNCNTSPNVYDKDLHSIDVIREIHKNNSLHKSSNEIEQYLEYYYLNKKTSDNKKISKFVTTHFNDILSIKEGNLISLLIQCIKIMKITSIDNILSFFFKDLVNLLKNKDANDIILLVYSLSSENAKISVVNVIFAKVEDVIKINGLEKSLLHFVEWADSEIVQQAIIDKFNNFEEDIMLDHTMLKLLEIIVSYENLNTNFIKIFISNRLKDLIKLDYGYYLVKRFIKITYSKSQQIEFLSNFISILSEDDLFSLNGSLLSQCIIRNFKLVEIYNSKDLEIAKSYDLEIINPYIKDKITCSNNNKNTKPFAFKNECAEYFRLKRKERLDVLFQKNYWVNQNSEPLTMFYDYLLTNLFHANKKYVTKRTYIQLLSCVMKFSTSPFYLKFLEKFIDDVNDLKRIRMDNDSNFRDFYKKLSNTAIYTTISFNDEILINNFLSNLDFESITTFSKNIEIIIELISKTLSYHDSIYHFNNIRTYTIIKDIKENQKVFREIFKIIIPSIIKNKQYKPSIKKQMNSINSYLSYKSIQTSLKEEKEKKVKHKKKKQSNQNKNSYVQVFQLNNQVPFNYIIPFQNINNGVINAQPNFYYPPNSFINFNQEYNPLQHGIIRFNPESTNK